MENTSPSYESFDISQYASAIDFNTVIAFVISAGTGIIALKFAFKGIDFVKRILTKA